jgi:hypothetical protein
MDLSSLKPYHGYQTSIIPFSSDHYFYLASWDRTPTHFPRFSNVWLVTPTDKRILFSDPPASSKIVCIYHDFHEIHGASIGIDWFTEDELHIECTSIDGSYELQAILRVQEPLTARLLVAIGSGPPTRFRTSSAVVAVSDFLVNSLVAKGGSVLLGKTETGQPFYHGETEKLFQIASGSMSLKGEDRATITNPTWPIEFGDAIPYAKPVLKLGTLYIPFEPGMVEDSG